MGKRENCVMSPHGSVYRTLVSEKALVLRVPNDMKVCERGLYGLSRGISFCPFCPSLSLYFGGSFGVCSPRDLSPSFPYVPLV